MEVSQRKYFEDDTVYVGCLINQVSQDLTRFSDCWWATWCREIAAKQTISQSSKDRPCVCVCVSLYGLDVRCCRPPERHMRQQHQGYERSMSSKPEGREWRKIQPVKEFGNLWDECETPWVKALQGNCRWYMLEGVNLQCWWYYVTEIPVELNVVWSITGWFLFFFPPLVDNICSLLLDFPFLSCELRKNMHTKLQRSFRAVAAVTCKCIQWMSVVPANWSLLLLNQLLVHRILDSICLFRVT